MDLHSGLPYWIVKNELYNYFNPLNEDHRTDVAIIGSGITGSLAAHELCSAGISCSVFDKRTIATGSTAASTSLLQYEIDVPLCEMIKLVGEEHAVAAYHASLHAIHDLEVLFKDIALDTGFTRVPSVLMASDRNGLKLIEKEFETRRNAGLPVTFLDREALLQQHDIKAPGALKTSEAAQMDCYKAATGLLKHNTERNGLLLFSHTEVVGYKETPQGYELKTSAGHTISCKYVVIAAGYEAGKFIPRKVMDLNSTYAIISDPVLPEQLWPERCMIWETAKPYFYMRTTADDRMIIGGADEEFKDPVKRDKLLPEKIKKLEKKFAAIYPEIPFHTDMAWCGTFSSTKDGLPYIGTWPGRDNMFFALGYGGNGITFSMIAAGVIKNKIKGIPDRREQIFGFER